MDMATGLRLVPAVIGVAVATLTAACGAAAEPSTSVSGDVPETATTVEGEAAVWDLGPSSGIDGSSTTFTALVSRLSCNSGVTGEVLAPDIQFSESTVAVTFSVAPAGPGGGDCQGNEEVAYEVALGEPLLDRNLVDGQCLPGGEAVNTSACAPDPTRHKPRQ